MSDVAGEIVDPVKALAERVADYVETAHTYGHWSKREAMVEAVRVACEDARSDTLDAISDATQRPKRVEC